MHPTATLSHPPAVMRNRIGVMACCVPELDFAEHCSVSHDVGASYVETFSARLQPGTIEAQTACAALQKFKQELLLVIAEHFDLERPDDYLAQLRDSIAFWRACGLQKFVTLRAGRSDQRELFFDVLRRAGQLVRDAGFIPLSQNHRGGMIENDVELAACKACNVGLHFDTQQFYVAGVNPIAAWNRLGRDVLHLHLADRFDTMEPAPFGEGSIGLERLLRRIHASGYRGAITLEPELGKNRDAEPHIRHAFQYCQQVLKPLDALGTNSVGHSVYHKDDAEKVTTDWGSLHWLSNDEVVDGSRQTVGLVTIKPGCSNPAHQHPRDHEVIVIQQGTCLHFCGEHAVRLNAGDVLHLMPGQPHHAINDGDIDCEMLVVYPTGRRGFEKVQRAE